MQRNFIFTMMGILAMILTFMSCSTPQNPSTNQQQMKELKLKDAEMLELNAPDQSDESVYQLSFMYESKLRHSIFYYQQYSGTMQEGHQKEKCNVLLTKKHRELPRSIYPLLTQGYIVVQFSWLGLETYQVIKEFKKLEPTARN
jgi:hypothetical protein